MWIYVDIWCVNKIWHLVYAVSHSDICAEVGWYMKIQTEHLAQGFESEKFLHSPLFRVLFFLSRIEKENLYTQNLLIPFQGWCWWWTIWTQMVVFMLYGIYFTLLLNANAFYVYSQYKFEFLTLITGGWLLHWGMTAKITFLIFWIATLTTPW